MKRQNSIRFLVTQVNNFLFGVSITQLKLFDVPFSPEEGGGGGREGGREGGGR